MFTSYDSNTATPYIIKVGQPLKNNVSHRKQILIFITSSQSYSGS